MRVAPARVAHAAHVEEVGDSGGIERRRGEGRGRGGLVGLVHRDERVLAVGRLAAVVLGVARRSGAGRHAEEEEGEEDPEPAKHREASRCKTYTNDKRRKIAGAAEALPAGFSRWIECSGALWRTAMRAIVSPS